MSESIFKRREYLITFVIPILDPDIIILSKFLKHTHNLNSILGQKKSEFLLILSISDQNSLTNIIKNLNTFSHIRYNLVPKEGIYKAYNTGIINSRGQYLNFLGLDDFFNLEKEVWKTLINKLIKSSPHLLVTHVQPFCKDLLNLPLKNVNPKFPPNMPLFHQGVFYKYNLFKNNLYPLSFKIAADFLHMLCLQKKLNKKINFLYLPVHTHYYSLNGFSSSIKNRILLAYEVCLSVLLSGKNLRFIHIKFAIGSLIKYSFYKLNIFGNS